MMPEAGQSSGAGFSPAAIPGNAGRCRHTLRAERQDSAADLIDLLEQAQSTLYAGRRAPIFYWEHPQRHEAMLAVGAAHEIRTSGPARFAAAATEALAVLTELAPQAEKHGSNAPLPRFAGGFAYGAADPTAPMWRGFPACRLVLPAELWLLKEGNCWLLRASPCPAGHTPSAARAPAATLPATERAGLGGAGDVLAGDRASWIERAERALSMIECGKLNKVVLSRCRTWAAERAFRMPAILRRLRDTRPGCFTFWICAGQADFFGSTPELLVRQHGRDFETQALAGTAARGATEEEDAQLASQLLHSPKNRREHAAVTRGIRDALAPLTRALDLNAPPSLIALPEAYHLRTPIRGKLRAPNNALELAGLLHPTPAVCGEPRAPAQALLRDEEAERGWYTGGVGWLGAHGDGEFAVALRAALVNGTRAALWAGAGIVRGSDPAAEFDETDIKMRALADVMKQFEPLPG